MSDVDVKNVTIVSKLRGFFLAKADLQLFNDRHADTVITND